MKLRGNSISFSNYNLHCDLQSNELKNISQAYPAVPLPDSLRFDSIRFDGLGTEHAKNPNLA